MLLYAYEQGYSILLNTTLMGLKKSDWMKIKDINFRELHIHLASGSFDEMIGVEIPVKVYEQDGKKSSLLVKNTMTC